MKKNLADRLLRAVDEKRNPSVVGLDPRINMIPEHVRVAASEKTEDPFQAVGFAFQEFNRAIIDDIKDIVPAVKPQVAFYEQYGSHGIKAYEETVRYAREKGLLVIGDVKRNDIGSTAEAYARAHLGEVDLVDGSSAYSFDTDMITVNPYLGSDGIRPFLEACKTYGKGIFILDKTSNPSSGELQDRTVEGNGKVYEIAARLIDRWGEELVGEKGYSSVGAVVGATYPREAQVLREIMKKAVFLIPGYGAQGGTADDILPCFNQDGYGGVVNSSRGIIFAHGRPPYSEEYGPLEYSKASRQAALHMKDDILASLERGNKLPEGW